jgi:hypothetical protein
MVLKFQSEKRSKVRLLTQNIISKKGFAGRLWKIYAKPSLLPTFAAVLNKVLATIVLLQQEERGLIGWNGKCRIFHKNSFKSVGSG